MNSLYARYTGYYMFPLDQRCTNRLLVAAVENLAVVWPGVNKLAVQAKPGETEHEEPQHARPTASRPTVVSDH